MNTFFKKGFPYAYVISMCLICISATVEPQFSIEDIRICAVSQTETSCPTDNPIFRKGADQVLINFNSSNLSLGDEIRFSWYRVDDSELFSTYLGNDYVSVTSSKSVEGIVTVTTSFPNDIALTPGTYEVVIHPPHDAKPIIKNFKVLD